MTPYQQRDIDLRVMGFGSYGEYRASDLWKGIRGQVFRRDRRECRCCRKKAEVVHHDSYAVPVLRGEDLLPLFAVCHKCHDRIEFHDGRKVRFEIARQRLAAMLTGKDPVKRKGKKKKKGGHKPRKMVALERSAREHGVRVNKGWLAKLVKKALRIPPAERSPDDAAIIANAPPALVKRQRQIVQSEVARRKAADDREKLRAKRRAEHEKLAAEAKARKAMRREIHAANVEKHRAKRAERMANYIPPEPPRTGRTIADLMRERKAQLMRS